MRVAWTCLLVLPLLAGCGLSPEEQRVVDASLANESERLWERIAWQPSFEAARAEAAKTGKPIFVMLVVNKDGEKNADYC